MLHHVGAFSEHITKQPARQVRRKHAWRDAALELIWPQRCVGCDTPQELICPDCRGRLPWISQAHACRTCGAPHGWMNCTECKGDWPVRSTVCAWSHEGVAASAIRIYKDGGERALALPLACALECALYEASFWPAHDGRARFETAQLDGLCFVPATSKAYARRGTDHLEAIAVILADMLGLPCLDVLVRLSSKDQRALGKAQREANVQGSCYVRGDIAGMSLLLIDDVCTTGATLKECAGSLLARGAKEVSAACVTRVW